MKDNALLVLNGPGLADLFGGGGGSGSLALEQLHDECSAHCRRLGLEVDFRQTDDEEELFRWIAQDSEEFAGLIINPARYSISGPVDFETYRSAVGMVAHRKKPVVEVHLSNIFREGAEPARPLQVPDSGMGFICGLGSDGYLLAISAIANRLPGAP